MKIILKTPLLQPPPAWPARRSLAYRWRPSMRPPTSPQRSLQMTHIATNDPAGLPPDLEREVQDSAVAIDKIMRHLSQSLFVDAAANYVTGDEAGRGAEHRRLVAAAVAPLLEELNDTFVATLDAYVTAAQERGPAGVDVVAVLLAVREEVLAQLAERLPGEMRVLNFALEAPTPEMRAEVLRRHTLDGVEPQCGAADLERAASRVIQDMEGLVEVPDRVLLARLCLIREELVELAGEAVNSRAAEQGGGGALGSSQFTVLRSVPRGAVAFLKEVMQTASSERRQALLEKAFKEDWDGGAAGAPNAGAADPATALRPGRFMDSVRAVQAEMLGPQYGGGEGVDPGVLLRLEEVRRAALLVLLDMAGEAGYAP